MSETPEHAEALLLVAGLTNGLPLDVVKALSDGAAYIAKQQGEIEALKKAIVMDKKKRGNLQFILFWTCVSIVQLTVGAFLYWIGFLPLGG